MFHLMNRGAPLVEIRLTVTQNLGKARALEALVAVAPLLYDWMHSVEREGASFIMGIFDLLFKLGVP